MIQAKCIQKFRDKHNQIYGYRLQDINGQIQDVKPENLKLAIKNNQIHVVNLTLTSDNRLVDTTEKQLQAKVLGKAPVLQDDSKYSEVAKALVVLNKELISMGESYVEIVESLSYYTENPLNLLYLDEYYDKPEYKGCKDEYDILDRISYKIFLELVNQKPTAVAEIIATWDEYDSYDTFKENLQYENVSKITQSKTYKALCIVYKHAKEQKYNKDAIKPLGEFLSKIKATGVASIRLGSGVGNTYYKYLDPKLFGTLSNDIFTVGHVITSSDIKELKEYSGYNYVLHKDINRCGAPQIALAAMFKNTDSGDVQIDIKLARRGYLVESSSCVGLVGYIKNLESIIVNPLTSVDVCAKKLATMFNLLAPKLYDISDANQSLYFMKKYGAPLEKISDTSVNYTDKELLDLAISRWTRIRGDKTPAKVEMSNYKDSNNFKVLYANNISQTGGYKKLYVKCIDGLFTINVVDGKDINYIIVSESGNIKNSIKESSAEISEILTKAIISANVRKI